MRAASDNNKRYAGILLAIVSLVLVALNCYRMQLVPITHDEAVCNGEFLHRSYSDIVNCHPPLAENHILNTVATKCCADLLHNNSLFVLRLPNLVSELVFLLMSYLLVVRLFTKAAWRISAFAVLTLNPFMFEFWGLSRGYGMAAALMLCCVYFFIAYIQNRKYWQLCFSFLFGVGSVYANFSLLNFYIAFNTVVIVHCMLQHSWRAMRAFLYTELPWLLLADGLLFVMIAKPLTILRNEKLLNHGGTTNVIHDTIRSLVMRSLFLDNYRSPVVIIIADVIFVSIIIMGVYWARNYKRLGPDKQVVTGIVLWLLLVVPILFRLVQHFSIHAKYLLDRAALFLIPLYMLHPIYWHYHRTRNKPNMSPIVIIISCFITFNFCRHVNVTSTRLWFYDQYAKTVAARASQLRVQPAAVKLCTDPILLAAVQYYLPAGVATDSLRMRYAAFAPDTSFTCYYLFKAERAAIPWGYTIDSVHYQGLLFAYKQLY